MLKKLFEKLFLIFSVFYYAEVGHADIWINSANHNGVKVGWLFDRAYEDYDLCVKPENQWWIRICRSSNRIGVPSANYHFWDGGDQHYGGFHTFGSSFKDGVKYTLQVRGIYNNGKSEDNLGERDFIAGDDNIKANEAGWP